ncbi:non-heme chloroperoxidase [Asanoa hainanensis]|uniref:Non-heme chloroperoxidase n=1 Tax=Asanoa hainanensis TaxID=560556 RepID=A0A239FNW2_9ACTN|nr:alpha/beta hydrolase [Asanoa hainanensis]SNS58495.1 non-heme chloroperoxidase [Asanoa hainanensis]
MPYVTVGQENTEPVKIYYEDHGSGPPVVLIHGYPLSGQSWEKIVSPLRGKNRIITYDRRGFGKSSQPGSGYDYDTFTADFNILMETLDLRDAVLVGHSMGTGEITRYLGQYGSARVSKGVLLSPLAPFLLKTGDNPEGVDGSVFEGIKQACAADRPLWIKQFFDLFFNVKDTMGKQLSQEAWNAHFNVGITASPIGTYDCVDSWLTDFRQDVVGIDVPMLVVQGTADQVLPFASTGKRLPPLVKDLKLVAIDGAPHSIPWTHAAECDAAIKDFMAA